MSVSCGRISVVPWHTAIDMQSFVYGIGGFFALFFLQLIACRWVVFLFGRCRKLIPTLFLIFLFIPLIGFWVTKDLSGTLLLLSISLSYLMAFPAAAAKSPSLEILRLIRSFHSQGGISKEDILKRLGRMDLLQDRIQDLIDDGFIKPRESQIEPRLVGKCLGGFFYYYRWFLRLPLGKG